MLGLRRCSPRATRASGRSAESRAASIVAAAALPPRNPIRYVLVVVLAATVVPRTSVDAAPTLASTQTPTFWFPASPLPNVVLGGRLAANPSEISQDCKCCDLPVENRAPVMFGAALAIGADESLEGAGMCWNALTLFFRWLNNERGGVCFPRGRRPAQLDMLRYVSAAAGSDGEGPSSLANATAQLANRSARLLVATWGDTDVASFSEALSTFGAVAVGGVAPPIKPSVQPPAVAPTSATTGGIICNDTSGVAEDAILRTCRDYENVSCEVAQYDDADFSAVEMCCACGGGEEIPETLAPGATHAPSPPQIETSSPTVSPADVPCSNFSEAWTFCPIHRCAWSGELCQEKNYSCEAFYTYCPTCRLGSLIRATHMCSMDSNCSCDHTCKIDQGLKHLPCVQNADEVPVGKLCSNTCEFLGDRSCDDGGVGSKYALCDLGTDCTDCGSRDAPTVAPTPSPQANFFAPSPPPTARSCNTFGGMSHPDGVTCCAGNCGQFCGSTASCGYGPGGSSRCCGAMIPDSWICGPYQAPCTLTDTTYTLGASNTNFCPEGRYRINDAEKCKNASASWGAANFTLVVDTNSPKGCHLRLVATDGDGTTIKFRSYFNSHISGSASEMAAPVCSATGFDWVVGTSGESCDSTCGAVEKTCYIDAPLVNTVHALQSAVSDVGRACLVDSNASAQQHDYNPAAHNTTCEGTLECESTCTFSTHGNFSCDAPSPEDTTRFCPCAASSRKPKVHYCGYMGGEDAELNLPDAVCDGGRPSQCSQTMCPRVQDCIAYCNSCGVSCEGFFIVSGTSAYTCLMKTGIVMAGAISRTQGAGSMVYVNERASICERAPVRAFRVVGSANAIFSWVYTVFSNQHVATMAIAQGSGASDANCALNAASSARNTGISVLNAWHPVHITVSAGATDNPYDLANRELYALNPDLVVACVGSESNDACEHFVRSVKKLEFSPRFLMLVGCVVDAEFVDALGDDGKFVLVTSQWLPSLAPSPSTAWTPKRFTQAFTEAFATPPNHEAASCWAAATSLLAATEDAKTTDSKTVLDALVDMDAETVFGRLRFDYQGQGMDSYKLVQLRGEGLPPVHIGPANGGPTSLALPMERWSERQCLKKLDKNGLSTGIWGFYTVEHFFPDAINHFRNKDFSAGSGPLYDFDINGAADAVLFAAMVLGMPVDMALDVVGWATEFAKSETGGRTGDARAVRDWLQHLVEEVFWKSRDVDHLLLKAAAQSFFLSHRVGQICAPCPAGSAARWDSVTNKRVCVLCADGSRTNPLYPLDATITDLGQFQRVCALDCGAAAACDPCRPGTFAEHGHPGPEACEDCDTGHVSPLRGSKACEMCPPGKSGDRDKGSTSCLYCARGYFSPGHGQPCERCRPGTVAMELGQTACEACGVGKMSSASNSVCELCEDGKYQHKPNSTNCISAPWGAVSRGVGASELTNAPGYYHRADPLAGEEHIFEWCLHNPPHCVENDRCAKGSAGIQCSVCLPGYARSAFMGDACFKCPALWWSLSMSVSMIVFVLGCALFLVAASVQGDRRPQDLTINLVKIVLLYAIIAHSASQGMGEVILQRRRVIGAESTRFCLALCKNLMLLGGAALTEQTLFSLSCLVQTLLEDASYLAQLADRLANATHRQWIEDLSIAGDIEELTELARRSEIGVVIFWAAFPIGLYIAGNILSLIYVVVVTFSKKSYYSEAIAFYGTLLEFSETSEMRTGISFECFGLQFGDDRWMVYAREHPYRILSIWWALPHAEAQQSGNLVNWRRFMTEMSPFVAFSTIFCYNAVLVGVTRPLRCCELGVAGLRAVFASELKCKDIDEPVMQISWGCSLVWAILFPIVFYRFLQSKKKRIEGAVIARARYNILVAGYTKNMFWWEAVVCGLKGAIILLSAMEASPERRNQMMGALAVAYAAICVVLRPFDGRCDELLPRLQSQLIVTWIVQLITTDFISIVNRDKAPTNVINSMTTAELRGFMEKNGASHQGMQDADLMGVARAYASDPLFDSYMVVVGTTCTFLIHLAFVLNLLYRMFLCRLGTFIQAKAYVSSLPCKGCVKRCNGYLRHLYHLHKRKRPYVSFDPLLGWAVVCGNRGDVAEPPAIPRGWHTPGGRPALSQAPGVPPRQLVGNEAVIQATKDHKAWLMRTLAQTLEVIAPKIGSTTFSVSLLEFAMRAAFELAHARTIVLTEEVETKTYWEDYETIVDLGSAELDPMDLLEADGDELMREPTMSTIATVSTRGARRRQQVLDAGDAHRQALQLVEPLGSTRPPSRITVNEVGFAVFKKAVEKVRRIEIKKAARSSFHVRLQQSMKANTNDNNLGEDESEDIPRLVKRMFHPLLFQRGVDLDSFQFALIELQHTPRFVLRECLDEFEKVWLLHNEYYVTRLKRYTKCVMDRNEQAGRPRVHEEPVVEPASEGPRSPTHHFVEMAMYLRSPHMETMEPEVVYAEAGVQVGSGGLRRLDTALIVEQVQQEYAEDERARRHKDQDAGKLPTAVRIALLAMADSHIGFGSDWAPEVKITSRYPRIWARFVIRLLPESSLSLLVTLEQSQTHSVLLHWTRFALQLGLTPQRRDEMCDISALVRAARGRRGLHMQKKLLEEEKRIQMEEDSLTALEDKAAETRRRVHDLEKKEQEAAAAASVYQGSLLGKVFGARKRT